MLAVTMTTTRLMLGSLPFLLLACGGGAVATHNGYAEGDTSPWTKAGTLRLSDNGEASADGTISFADRQRARWYMVELPGAGVLTARLTVENRAPGTDVAMEILDSGYNVVVPGETDDDVGQAKKVRENKNALPGKSYIHLYALGRADRGEYTLRVHFEPKPQAAVLPNEPPPSADHSSFPWTVPNLPALAQINPSDDTPLHGRAPKPVAQQPKEEKPPEPPPDTGPSVRARITEYSDTGSGVKVVLNKGSGAGIDAGWQGYVVGPGNKALPKSSLSVRAVRDNESDALIRGVTLDDVQKNPNVVVKPPK
jgi:hypothetical protein